MTVLPSGVTPVPDPSRRRALRVAAWSVPVIAAAVATPLAAASDALTITLGNGDVDPGGKSTRFEGVIIGDPVPLTLFVTTAAGGPAAGALTATLSGADGIAEWSTDAGGSALVSFAGGQADLELTALGYGSFQVVISAGDKTWVFTLTIAA